MFRLQLKVGTYVDLKAKQTYKAPTEVISPLRLDERWPEKFDLLEEFEPEEEIEEPEDKGVAVTNIAPPKTKKAPPKSKAKTSTPKGKSADSMFDYSPKKTGLRVFRTGANAFRVYDEEDMQEPLNEKPLKKNEVLAFIKSQCEE